MYTEKIIKRFWSKVNKTDYCWKWTGSSRKRKTNFAYGDFFITSRKRIRSHRLSWELHFGEIPKNLFVCHHCDNPSCVRPEHLFLGTPKDNTIDAINKGRIKPRFPHLYGETHGRSKLTEKQILEIRESYNNNTNKKELSKKFKVTHANIHAIIIRKTWRHV